MPHQVASRLGGIQLIDVPGVGLDLDVFEVPGPGVVLHRVGHQPVPRGLPGRLIGGDVAEIEADQLVEQLNRRDHVRAVLLSNDVRLGVDAKRPGRLRGAAGSNVARQNVGRLHGRVPEADGSAELVVLEERDADLADLVGLDDADAIPYSRSVAGLRTLIGERAGVAAGERDAGPIPGRRRQPVIEVDTSARREPDSPSRRCRSTRSTAAPSR